MQLKQTKRNQMWKASYVKTLSIIGSQQDTGIGGSESTPMMYPIWNSASGIGSLFDTRIWDWGIDWLSASFLLLLTLTDLNIFSLVLEFLASFCILLSLFSPPDIVWKRTVETEVSDIYLKINQVHASDAVLSNSTATCGCV